MNTWPHLFRSYRWSFKLFFLFAGCIVVLWFFSYFLIWNENRHGYLYNDVILNSFTPIDLSLPIAILTNFPIFGGIMLMFRSPSRTVLLFWGTLLMCLIRSASLYMVVLEPPATIIPLDDTLLVQVFYGGTSLKRDLFFSGHTANLILTGLMQDNKKIRQAILICAGLVGVMVVLQHVHYVIDVLAAPFFAYAVYRLSFVAAKMSFPVYRAEFDSRSSY